uniref:Uncharacterized protein n=1 Tax=Arundo donax TaxID=35708 RepID=A0A0A9ECK6_ARUDO
MHSTCCTEFFTALFIALMHKNKSIWKRTSRLGSISTIYINLFLLYMWLITLLFYF